MKFRKEKVDRILLSLNTELIFYRNKHSLSIIAKMRYLKDKLEFYKKLDDYDLKYLNTRGVDVYSKQQVMKEGDKIRAIRSKFDNHILKCGDHFGIDLSEFVTIRKNDKGVLMAGQVSLQHYKKRKVEVITATK